MIIFEDKKFVLSKGYYIYNGSGKNKSGLTYLHIAVWEKHNNKKVPRGHVIHHIDHNPLNNKIENLKCMARGAHQSYHAKQKWKDRKLFTGTCAVCKSKFKSKAINKSKVRKHCSYKCFISANEKTFKCLFCKINFSRNRFARPPKFCTKRCSAFYRHSKK